MVKIGSADSRLIIIRGNSGSGKSTLAAAVRSARPRGIAIVGQDLLRRNILHVPDEVGSPAVDYIGLSARYALDRGLHVIVEGILYSDIYGDMLRQLIAGHEGMTRCYRYSLTLSDTLQRHATKPIAGEVNEAQLRQWWREDDRLSGIEEGLIGPEQSLAQSVSKVLADCGWQPVARAEAQQR